MKNETNHALVGNIIGELLYRCNELDSILDRIDLELSTDSRYTCIKKLQNMKLFCTKIEFGYIGHKIHNLEDLLVHHESFDSEELFFYLKDFVKALKNTMLSIQSLENTSQAKSEIIYFFESQLSEANYRFNSWHNKQILDVVKFDRTANDIVIIDDDPDILEFLGEMISSVFDYDVTMFEHPEKALNYLEKHRPLMLVTDYAMPKINGVELLKRVNDMKVDYPILLFTGNSHCLTESEHNYVREKVTRLIKKGNTEIINAIKYSLDKLNAA